MTQPPTKAPDVVDQLETTLQQRPLAWVLLIVCPQLVLWLSNNSG